MKVKIKDVLANPFRNMEHYKINRKKIAQLIASFETTCVWPVLIVRKKNGKVELAFGHHRLAAAKERYGDEFEIEVIVLDLSDEEMLKYMANENQSDFATSFVTEMETVEAVVKAFADGKIQLASLSKHDSAKDRRRYAPGFIKGSAPIDASQRLAYTSNTVGAFLGWVTADGVSQERVRASLAALELIEQGHLTLEHLKNQGTEASKRIVSETATARDKQQAHVDAAQEWHDKVERDFEKAKGTKKAPELERKLTTARKELEVAVERAKKEPAAVAERVTSHERNKKRKEKEAKEAALEGPAEKELPTLNEAAETLRKKIENVLTSHDELGKMLKEIVEFKEQLDFQTLRFLALALGRLCKRSERCVVALGMNQEQIKPKQRERIAA